MPLELNVLKKIYRLALKLGTSYSLASDCDPGGLCIRAVNHMETKLAFNPKYLGDDINGFDKG